MGLPETLVQRSAEARAADTGASVDEILAAWAGGEDVAAAPPPAAAQPETVDEEAAEPEAAEPEATEPVAAAVTTAPELSATAVTTRTPVPDEVTSAEAAHLPEVVTVATAGIKERTNFVIPKWLTAVMLIVPLFALFALGGASTGECGEATELTTDVVTGNIVNCDGSEFTGQSVGGGGTDFIALGGDIYEGSAVTGVNCAGCHGATGQGSGTFPALTGVLTTFGSCTDHIEWVMLGTAGFESEGRETYGNTNKPVRGAGVMPGFGGSLTAEQIASVDAFERARFGGEDPEVALVDCGLAEPPDDGDGADGEGESNTEGGGEGDGENSTEASTSHSG